MKKIQDSKPSKSELMELKYEYQPKLTEKLDNWTQDFDQNLINEIVLWKVNRYAQLSSDTLELINKIDTKLTHIDVELTRKILSLLLDTKGVRLPMASTILRFKNPHIYQIIDQRVYRVIYGFPLKLKTRKTDSIDQYLDYLEELDRVCTVFQIPFSESDRILYEYDRKVNRGEKLKN